MKTEQFFVTSMQDYDVTVVEINLPDYNMPVIKGSARRERDDEFDAQVGVDLATSRALEKLAVQYRKRAQGRMNTLENNRKQKQAAAVKKVQARLEAIDVIREYTRVYREGSFSAPSGDAGTSPVDVEAPEASTNSYYYYHKAPMTVQTSYVDSNGIVRTLLADGRTVVVDVTTGVISITPSALTIDE